MRYFLLLFLLPLFYTASAQKNKPAPKPVYADPIYDGAADPVIIWNPGAKKWWMFYTNRRANVDSIKGVEWVHGSRIGIAESSDGKIWKYKDTANINCRFDSGYTYWAPEIIADNGVYHMYLTYVPGTFADWNHPRKIVHLSSTNLKDWGYLSTLNLVNEKVIDACVYKLPDNTWRMWYNNEKDGKSIYYADSKDLHNWEDKGKAIDARGEGPKVFAWQGKYFMIVDVWKGMDVYSSTDLLQWTKQKERILETPGNGTDDQAIGGHCDVVVNNEKAFIYYFTHPGRSKATPATNGSTASKRSVIQLAELTYKNGEISCDRNAAVKAVLKHQ